MPMHSITVLNIPLLNLHKVRHIDWDQSEKQVHNVITVQQLITEETCMLAFKTYTNH